MFFTFFVLVWESLSLNYFLESNFKLEEQSNYQVKYITLLGITSVQQSNTEKKEVDFSG